MRKASLAVVTVLLVSAVWATSSFAADPPPLAKAPFNAEQAKEFQQQWSKHIGKPVVQTNSIGMKMVLLPPGEYTMGRTEEQFDKVLEIAKQDGREPARAATWEMLMMPGHQVRITKPFYMGATEVTVGQYRAFCEASGYKTEAEQGLNGGVPYRGRRPICTWRKPMVWIRLQQKDDEPVLHLCWNDCVAFCKWLSKKEGVEYCLPTEGAIRVSCTPMWQEVDNLFLVRLSRGPDWYWRKGLPFVITAGTVISLRCWERKPICRTLRFNSRSWQVPPKNCSNNFTL